MAENNIKEKETENKKKHKIIGIIVLIILLLLGAFIGVRYYMNAHSDGSKLETSIKAELGELDNKTTAEIERELNKTVEKSYINMSINANPQFISGDSEGTLLIENIKENNYAQEIVITINDTGEEIYRSGLLLPGYHIEKDFLSVDLDAGNYECTATFIAYDTEIAEEPIQVGVHAMGVRISVLS